MKLNELLGSLRRGWLILVVIPLIAVLCSYILSVYVMLPVYQASTTLMVVKKPTFTEFDFREMGPEILLHDNLLTNNKLAKDYCQLAKSRLVMEEVISKSYLNISSEELQKKVGVKLLGDTELFQISVKDSNPDRAAKIANVAANVLIEKVEKIMKIRHIVIVDNAFSPITPVKPNVFLNNTMAGILGLMLAICLVFLRENLKRANKEEFSGEAGSTD